MQTVRVRKMRAGTAELLRGLVHHIDKGRNIAADCLGDHVRRLVGRNDHQIIQRVAQTELLADLQPHLSAGFRDSFNRGIRDRKLQTVEQVAGVFQGDQAGHNLRQAGRIDPLLRVLCIDHNAGVQLQQKGRGTARLIFRSVLQQNVPVLGRVVRPGDLRLFRLRRRLAASVCSSRQRKNAQEQTQEE